MTTVAVTGGNGQVGRAVLEHLGDHGYGTVNCNRGKRGEAVADAYLRVDLTDPGEVYGALARADPDAVAHLGMVPNPEGTPGHVTFESNALSPYLVLEAASALGVDTVCLASSLSVLGAGFEPEPVDVDSLPVDETHPLSPTAPTNPYGLGKQVLEVVGDAFGRGGGPPRSVTSLRFPWVTDEAAMRETFLERDRSLPALRASGDFHVARNTLFAYLALPDAARAVRRALEADVDGHERLWVVADDTTASLPSADLAGEVYPDAEVRTGLSDHAALVDNRKAARVLDWRPERSWRDL